MQAHLGLHPGGGPPGLPGRSQSGRGALKESDEAEQKVDERQLRVREELGKTFLSELGSLGRVLATSKLGMAPELAELGDIVATSPELAEAIRDPDVRAMLKDDKTRKELAQLLVLASKRPGGDTPPKAA